MEIKIDFRIHLIGFLLAGLDDYLLAGFYTPIFLVEKSINTK